jgi:hypothetical protein
VLAPLAEGQACVVGRLPPSARDKAISVL